MYKISKIKGRTTFEFYSYRDILDYVSLNKFQNANSKMIREKRFTSTSWNEALRYLETGWTEGTAEMTDISDRIKTATNRDGSAYNIQYDVTGDYIDMGRYMTGEPETFGNVIAEPMPEETIDISVDVCFSAYVTEEQIFNRGAAITALIEQLQRNYFVTLKVLFRLNANSFFWKKSKSKNHKEDVDVIFYVDMKNEYSRDLTAFYLANTAFFRRIGFAILETYFEKDDLGGYGKIIDHKPEPNEIHFGADNPLMNRFDTIEKSVELIKKMLEKYNKDK